MKFKVVKNKQTNKKTNKQTVFSLENKFKKQLYINRTQMTLLNSI